MKRLLIGLGLCCLFGSATFPLLAAQDSFEDYLPIRSGMKLSFHYILAHVEQKGRTWSLIVNKASFPDSISYTWTRPHKDEPLTGNRTLNDLKSSREFNPWFKKDESKTTDDTAPWISLQVLKELQEQEKTEKFREGGSGAINWAACDLKVKEKTIFPVYINGKPEALHAFRVNKGFIIWNNPKNPLVLQYEPLGIPIITSVTGWKLTAINY